MDQEHMQQNDGICIMKERSVFSDLRKRKTVGENNDENAKKEEGLGNDDGKHCGVEMNTEAVEEVLNEGDYISCNHCGEKRKTKDELKEHIYSKHLSLIVCDQGGADEGEDRVKKCRANQKEHLKAHMLKHSGEKPYKCNLCEFESSQKGILKTHMLKHTGEKPHKCNIWDTQPGARSDLAQYPPSFVFLGDALAGIEWRFEGKGWGCPLRFLKCPWVPWHPKRLSTSALDVDK
ncbi:hypothetical protein J437_LFUL009009 [Ladona fulva]|uniref:C2H2-type domain-containing protein n=1 Tax=Ladona fulva TaxID=123851 RepID=A0A8K0NYW6_LADFU|nr:hypothetical protein J437_LFUL009009 [Ladona fulva]